MRPERRSCIDVVDAEVPVRPDDSVATLHECIKAEERSLLAWRTVSEYTVAMNFEWDEQKN